MYDVCVGFLFAVTFGASYIYYAASMAKAFRNDIIHNYSSAIYKIKCGTYAIPRWLYHDAHQLISQLDGNFYTKKIVYSGASAIGLFICSNFEELRQNK